ncbi:MAG: hypothetical protein IJI57_04160 [Flexilinea sp.]|nr:hypothetical protein [Flexilinea sp.]
MTNQERWNLYDSGELHQMIAIELLDWAGYWASVGVENIEGETLRQQSRRAIRMILEDPSYTIRIVTGLFVSDDDVKNATEITDALVHTVVVRIMANRLEWITDVFPPEAE